MKRKHRNIGDRVHLILDEVLHLMGHSPGSGADVARGPLLQLTRLEERMLMSASPMAMIAEVAMVSAESSPTNETVEPTANTSEPTPDSAVDVQNQFSDVTVREISVDTTDAVQGIELIVIDYRVQDADTLLSGLLSQDRDVRLLRLDANHDGLTQITEKLEQLGNVSAIHLLTHGRDGEIFLGSTRLNAGTLAQHAPELLAWQHSLTANADLLLYGCDVAESPDGKDFVESLSRLTEADIAASTDLTGTQRFGGDWELEYQLGAMETHAFGSNVISGDWNDLLGIITVSTTTDVLDGDTSSVAALLASKGMDGFISLREAIIATNNTVGSDTIFLTAGTFTLSIGGQGENSAFTGDLDIRDGLTISGAGSGLSIIDANSLDRVLHVFTSSAVTLEDITIRGGVLASNNWGGGVFVDSGSSLTLNRVVVTGNSTRTGAGIYNYGTLIATDTIISNNVAGDWGGGLYNDGGNVTFDRVTISGNSAGTDGGGINNAGSGASMSLTNVTISGNTATSNGGGIWTNRAVTATNSTIAFNAASSGAGIFGQGSGVATLKNTVLHNPAGVNANKAMISLGYNIDSDGTAGLTGTGDIVANPLLGTLAMNGGLTPTHALLAGSPGVNAGTLSGAPINDQRGFARFGATDIGAFELTANVVTVDTTDDVVNGDTSSVASLLANKGLDGKISLREAILATNNTPNLATPDVIIFNIADTDGRHYYYRNDFVAGTLSNVQATTLADSAITDFDPDYPYAQHSWFRINVNPALTQLTVSDAVLIDGYSQAGASPNTLAVGNNARLRIELTISGANALDGLDFSATSDGSTVRGLAINNFGYEGLYTMPGADSITIQGNFIGTDITGTIDRGNSDSGIQLRSGGNLVGGSNPEDRNVISGNASRGLSTYTAGPIASNNVVRNNYFGLDATGQRSLGNTGAGVQVYNQNNMQILDNVISGNTTDGVWLRAGSSANNTVVKGNLIGLAADGVTSIGNGAAGIFIESTTNNGTIGGVLAGEANTIAYNTGDGVFITSGTKVAIRGNSIFSNGGLGIDLKTNGVAPNDALDTDTGANNVQNYPIILSASVTGTDLTVTGTLSTSALLSGNLDFYWSSVADGSGYGEAKNYIGSTGIATDLFGLAGFSKTFIGAGVPVGAIVTATMTDSLGNTSEFSLNRTTVNGNIAPTLITTASPTLATQNEDAGAPAGTVGTLVSSLVDFLGGGGLDNVFDPNSGTLPGIAVTGADTANGVWWYSTDNGSIWNSLGVVSDTNARLLAADATTRLYFQSNTNWNGAISNAITFRAWDGTSGIAGGTASLPASTVLDQFNSVSYSNNNGTANWAGNWIENDNGGSGAGGGSLEVNSNELRLIADSAGDWIYRDVNLSGASAATLSFDYKNKLSGSDSVVVQVSSNGGVSYTTLPGGTFSQSLNAGNGSASFDITSSIAANTRIRFYVAGAGGSEDLRVDNVQVQSVTAGGTTAFSSSRDTASITIDPVNDGPVISVADSSVTFTEGNPSLVIDSGLLVTDIDSSQLTGATVQISSNFRSGEDVLSYTLSGGITGSFNAGTGVLTLSGNATLLQYETVLRTVGYYNPSASPDPAARTILFTVTDGAASAADSRVVNIQLVNSPPVINSNGGGDSAATSVAENTMVATAVTATDADLPAQTLTYSISGGADAAKFSINNTNGMLTFVTAPNYEMPTDSGANNVYDVMIQVSDGTLTDTQSMAVTVTAVNDNTPMITSNGGGATASISIAENTTAVTTVVATDADLPAQTLTYSISGGADAAKFTINSSTGVLRFVTAPDYEVPADNGSNNVYDVVVRVNDGTLSDSQSISVRVTDTNEAPTANAGGPYVISEGDGLTVVAGVSIDPEGLPLTYGWDIDGDGLFTDATSSTATLTWGQLRTLARPVNDNGTRVIALRVTDAGGISTVATSNLTVTNTVPTVNVTGNATTSSGRPYVISLATTDPGADTITSYRINWGDGTTETVSGTASSATHTYLIPGGTRNVSVLATDEDGTFPMNGGPLVVTVLNTAPSAPTLSDSVVPGLVRGASVGVLNFTDPDSGDSHTWTVSDNRFTVAGSTLTLKSGRQLDPSTEPTVTLTVTVTDASGASGVASLTLRVNNPPVSAADAYAVDGTQQLNISSPSLGVLANDVDADGDAMSANLISGPSRAATFGLNADGTFWYRAVAGYSGGDSFQYRVNDGENVGAVTTVTLAVNQPASLAYSSLVSTVAELQTLTMPLQVGTFTVSDDGLGANTLTLTGTDAALFSLDSSYNLFLKAGLTIDFSVQTRFRVTALLDDVAISGTPDASRSLVINVQDINVAPVASTLPNVVVLEDALPGTISTASAFRDIDGDALSYSVNAVSQTPGLIRTLSINPTTGVISYSLNANAFGTATLRVTGKDPSNAAATVEFQLIVQPVNDAPVAVGYSTNTLRGQSLTTATPGVLSSVNDADLDPLTVAVVSGPANGIVVMQANGSFVYTPNAGFQGTDSFSFVASDGKLLSNVGTATINVQPQFIRQQPGSSTNTNGLGTSVSTGTSGSTGSTSTGPGTSGNSGTGNSIAANAQSGTGSGGTAGANNGVSNVTLPQGVFNPTVSGTENDTRDNDKNALIGFLQLVEGEVSTRRIIVAALQNSFESQARNTGNDSMRRSNEGLASHNFDATFNPSDRSSEAYSLNTEREALYKQLAGRVDKQSDAVAEQLEQNARLKSRVVGSVGVVTTGFSVGYLFWAVRLGTLASGLLAQVPAWTMLDPLLVIDGDQKDDDKESLQNIIDRQQAKVNRERVQPETDLTAVT